MSRTYNHRGYRRWWDKDSTDDRRWFRRLFRARTRQAMREGRYDCLPVWKRTEGWITW